jgi:integrase/recombinase XerD
MNNIVAEKREPARRQVWREAGGLYAKDGGRKYLTASERQRVLTAVGDLPPSRALFALTLAWTGARVSEVLALTPASFHLDSGLVAVTTLKRRRHLVREVPVPPELMAALDSSFALAAAQRDPEATTTRLWKWRRETAWRIVKGVMEDADVGGRCACPKGLRHSFGIGALQAGVPLNLVQRWLGHASLATTAIYADALGPEEMEFARRFWSRGALTGSSEKP